MSNTKPNYVKNKVVIITGASSGFGALAAWLLAERGAEVVLAARSEDKGKALAEKIKATGGEAAYIKTDVAKRADVFAMADFAVKTYGAIDVLVNNAGTMPHGFFSDHAAALDAWENCIDTSIKGTLYGICAVYDQMISQGRGQFINISSIYANYPVAGARVYQVAKMGVQYLADSLRSECQGKIKVTVIKPTDFMRTGLQRTNTINPAAGAGLVGDLIAIGDQLENPAGRPDYHGINNIHYCDPDPEILAGNIVYAIDQPWGISIGDVTVRASGDLYVL